MIRRISRSFTLAVVGIGALLVTIVPASAITGGTEDTGNTYSNVGWSSSTSRTGDSGARARSWRRGWS